ncbi:Signal recognition particle subunit SRP72 [Caligus rogercresseyi]|uniref:Signal recognition particle subunit SRP72 n=1 Tax=Caligus rogercresseyi TaxID=217165 RepID=A0A7T8JWJ8_CALRO|nr:Signal recognition particle subunit SRP72 [Caligus rogercresseyi]
MLTAILIVHDYALESSAFFGGSKKVPRVGSLPSPDMSKKESRDLVEKKKKKKLPMNYDPNVEPDPERWIPKRERIAFRKHLKRERRNKGEKFTGAQGDNYDYSSSRKATPKSPHQKTPQPTASRHQQQTRRQQRKENKKKGF